MTARISIQTGDFDVSREIAALTGVQAHVGAVATFTGIVRGDDGLIALTLEHYPGMTEREIARHADEANARWKLDGITVIHRIGRLETGAQIVLVAVASSHRGDAFAACEFLMDYLKTRAPFWKQEERADGTHWVEARESDDRAAERWR
ncbi:MAG: molybdenum cofactor biosynthesis protein MoaE [Alphaproteobacteria bacterium]|nr:molybdenum cofactor biosynthesis protein MoaE [Alphaproteobacteria bacterium]